MNSCLNEIYPQIGQIAGVTALIFLCPSVSPRNTSVERSAYSSYAAQALNISKYFSFERCAYSTFILRRTSFDHFQVFHQEKYIVMMLPWDGIDIFQMWALFSLCLHRIPTFPYFPMQMCSYPSSLMIQPWILWPFPDQHALPSPTSR